MNATHLTTLNNLLELTIQIITLLVLLLSESEE